MTAPISPPAQRRWGHANAPAMAPSTRPGLPNSSAKKVRVQGSMTMPMSDSRYLFFHPPRLPGAPPVERGAGPNSGPDSRELVGWMIRLVEPNGFSGSAGLGR